MDTKRTVFVRSLLMMCLLLILPYARAQHPLTKELDILLQGKQAKVGVAVVFEGRETFTYNNPHHYPLMSVFKFHQALAVMDYLDTRQMPLETEIYVRKADLLPDTYSPLRDARPEGEFNISVGELLRYSISESDNNACDILLRYIGGTGVVDKYVRTLGIEDFKIEANEEKLNEAFEYQYLNWTTPFAAVQVMEKFRTETLFRHSGYKEYLEKLMIGTVTGNDKLKAGLPREVVFGHKTGSSGRNKSGLKAGDNDMGFVRLPDGRQYSIAVFVTDSREDDKTNATLISEISRKVYEYYNAPKERKIPYTSEQNFADTIPFEFSQNRILISASVNGTERKFLFDTGASSLLLNKELLSGEDTYRGDSARDANGVRIAVNMADVRELRLGKLHFNHYPATLWDMNENSLFNCEGVDGLIGSEILQNLSVKIDTRNQRLILTDRKNHFKAEKGKRRRMKVIANCPLLDIKLFRRLQETGVLFDTGAPELYDLCDEVFILLKNRMPKKIERCVTDCAYGASSIGITGAGRDTLRYRLRFDWMKIGPVTFRNVMTETHTGVTSRVGAGLLNYGQLILDFPRKQYLFMPYDGISSVILPDTGGSGISFIPEEGRIKIGLVWENSKAYRIGVRRGFVVKEVNGYNVEDDFCALLKLRSSRAKSLKAVDLQGKEQLFLFSEE